MYFSAKHDLPPLVRGPKRGALIAEIDLAKCDSDHCCSIATFEWWGSTSPEVVPLTAPVTTIEFALRAKEAYVQRYLFDAKSVLFSISDTSGNKLCQEAIDVATLFNKSNSGTKVVIPGIGITVSLKVEFITLPSSLQLLKERNSSRQQMKTQNTDPATCSTEKEEALPLDPSPIPQEEAPCNGCDDVRDDDGGRVTVHIDALMYLPEHLCTPSTNYAYISASLDQQTNEKAFTHLSRIHVVQSIGGSALFHDAPLVLTARRTDSKLPGMVLLSAWTRGSSEDLIKNDHSVTPLPSDSLLGCAVVELNVASGLQDGVHPVVDYNQQIHGQLKARVVLDKKKEFWDDVSEEKRQTVVGADSGQQQKEGETAVVGRRYAWSGSDSDDCDALVGIAYEGAISPGYLSEDVDDGDSRKGETKLQTMLLVNDDWLFDIKKSAEPPPLADARMANAAEKDEERMPIKKSPIVFRNSIPPATVSDTHDSKIAHVATLAEVPSGPPCGIRAPESSRVLTDSSKWTAIEHGNGGDWLFEINRKEIKEETPCRFDQYTPMHWGEEEEEEEEGSSHPEGYHSLPATITSGAASAHQYRAPTLDDVIARLRLRSHQDD